MRAKGYCRLPESWSIVLGKGYDDVSMLLIYHDDVGDAGSEEEEEEEEGGK